MKMWQGSFILQSFGAFVTVDPTKGKTFLPVQKSLTLNVKMRLAGIWECI